MPTRGGFSLDSSTPAPRAGNLRRILAETEKRIIVEALRSAGGNKSKAAKDWASTEHSLYEKMRTHGLDPDAEHRFHPLKGKDVFSCLKKILFDNLPGTIFKHQMIVWKCLHVLMVLHGQKDMQFRCIALQFCNVEQIM